MKTELNFRTLFLYIILALFLVIQLFPLLWLFLFSLKSNGEIFGGNVMGLPKEWLWGNYSSSILKGDIVLYFANSLIVTGVSVALTIILASMAAYAISRMKWKLSGPVLSLFLMGMMIPLHSALLPLFLILSKMNMLNSYSALIFPYTAFGLPIAIFIFTGFYKAIPMEMEESACMEGCSIYGAFYRIIFPLLKPAAATVAIFLFLTNWNELMFAVTFISKRAYKTLTVGIVSLSSKYRTQWGPIGAAMVVGISPSLILYLFLSKSFQKNIQAGALKG